MCFNVCQYLPIRVFFFFRQGVEIAQIYVPKVRQALVTEQKFHFLPRVFDGSPSCLVATSAQGGTLINVEEQSCF